MFGYNKDDKKRQQIIEEHGYWTYGYKDKVKYDLLYFAIDSVGLKMLIDEKFADPEDRQNNAPSLGDIQKFIETHPNFKACGYIVTPERDDYRVSIEEVRGEELSREDICDFANAFHTADEFKVLDDGSCRAWYD